MSKTLPIPNGRALQSGSNGLDPAGACPKAPPASEAAEITADLIRELEAQGYRGPEPILEGAPLQEALDRALVTAGVTTDQLQQMAAIGKLLLTQDNLGTAEPIFYVEELARVYHAPSDEGEWRDADFGSPEDAQALELDEIRRETGRAKILGYEWVTYVSHWERVTACLTRAGAEDFIRVDGHNHRRHGVEPRIFVGSGHRNAEWIAVRKFLLALAGGPNA